MHNKTFPRGQGWLPRIATINSWLLILLAFGFMWSIALGNALLFLILILWLWEGNFRAKLQQVKDNPVVWAVLAFIAAHLLGLLWTQDWAFAEEVLRKVLKLLMLPVLITVVRLEHIRYYLGALVLSMFLLVLLSYGIYWGLIPPYELLKLENANDATPFVSHIIYNPVLAFTLYLLLYTALLRRDVNKRWKGIALLLFSVMAVNMFLTEGRMGQLVFILFLALLVFQYYAENLVKSALLSLLLVVTLVPAAYWLSPVVQSRVDLAVHEIQHYHDEPNSSVGLRVIMLLNSLEIIREHPLLGVGTGDYRMEYAKVNQKNFPEAERGEVLTHPHNVYVQQMVQLGLLGLLTLLYFFYAMLKVYKHNTSPLRPLLLALPLFYAVIFFSDGYLGNHYLVVLFLLCGAIFYGKTDTTAR